MKIVPLTSAHLDALFPDVTRLVTVRGFAAVDGDKVLGVCGVCCKGGEQELFLDTTPEIGPVTLVKLVKRLRTLPGRYAVAKCDPGIEAAGRFLAHFGFTERSGGVWTWEK